MEDKEIKETLGLLLKAQTEEKARRILQTPQGKRLLQDMMKTIFPPKK